jgi:putative hydroxymethylpyrimidine transport system ATP-binding protein
MLIDSIHPPTITVHRAQLAFRGVTLFENLDFTLPAGKWTCLLGPSGIGKTTLLRLIANLVSDDNTLLNADINSDASLPLKDQIAYLAQSDLLLPWLTVLDNVMLQARLRYHTASERKLLKEKALDLLRQINLQHAAHLYPRQLSGGMRQRAALARTLLEDKPVVLMDEPFSSVDAITRYNLQTLAADLLRNRTVLLVTHDPLEALRLANHIYIMSGSPATLNETLLLDDETPRDPSSPRMIELQAHLYQSLATLYEMKS